MLVRLSHYSLHFHPTSSPWRVDTSYGEPWMKTAWQLTFEMPQEQPPLHHPKDAPWEYQGGSIWRTGPTRMSPLICLYELIQFLIDNDFRVLAGFLQDELFELGLGSNS